MKAYRKQVVKLLGIIIIHLVLVITVRSVLAQTYKIPSGSMRPTLEIGDHILVSKLTYGIHMPFTDNFLVRFKNPTRGEVVVFIFPEDRSKDFIKRVIGTAGEIIDIRDKKVWVNGQLLEEPYTLPEEAQTMVERFKDMDNFGPVRVPEGKIFVLGDNRDRSYDSRYWGFVDVDDVKGRAVIIYWSWDRKNQRVRWKRMGDSIS